MTSPETDRPSPAPLLKLGVELGPLVVFFVANARVDIYFATKAFMLAIVLSLATSWHLERRVPVMPLVTAVVVLIFGGLTIYLADELFIQLKPTIVNLLFASVLLGGLVFGHSFLKQLMGPALDLTPEGWRALTLRFGLFFVFLALLNEVVRRNFSTDTWVSFKVFGIMPLTLVFGMAQVRLIERHKLETLSEDEGPGAPS